MTFLYIFGLIVLFLPLRIFFPAKLLGHKKLPPKKKRLIIACNHFSAGDPMFIGVRFPWRQFHFPAKKEIFKNRFIAWVLRSLGGVPVSRGDGDINFIRSITALLNKEKTVCIFPEGTRNRTDEDLLNLKHGAALFALKTGAPIVPMYIAKKQRFLRRNYIYVGKPFVLEGFEGERLNKETLERASLMLAERIIEAKHELERYLERKGKKKITLEPVAGAVGADDSVNTDNAEITANSGDDEN